MRCQFSPDVFALWRVGQSLENVTFLGNKTGQVIVSIKDWVPILALLLR